MSLPWVFKTTLETIPSENSYLSVPDDKLLEWSARLGRKRKPRVGLVWSGSTTHKNDHNRSLAFKSLAPILTLPLEFHCLQKEIREEDAELFCRHPGIKTYRDELKDFTDTGALIEQMDLVVSVDTSVAHLTGALGKRVWILLPHIPDYRWLLDREDTPWYPSAKLYRQDESRAWDNLIERIRTDLSSMSF